MNDIVVMAPAAVLDLPFTWTTMGDRSVRATFTNANDRTQEDAKGRRNVPWSTPISGYREIDGIRVGARGDANWVETSGEWTYGKFEIRSIAYNVDK